MWYLLLVFDDVIIFLLYELLVLKWDNKEVEIFYGYVYMN